MAEAVFGGHGGASEMSLGGRTVSRGVFGGIALVLGIVGLAIGTARPIAEAYLDPIAQASLGVAVIAFGMALASHYMHLASAADADSADEPTVIGTTVDMFVGGAVLVLGVLAILRVAPDVLIPIQVILVGTALLLNSAASMRAIMLEGSMGGSKSLVRRINDEMALTGATARAFAGLAVGVLGIIALTSTEMVMLTLASAIIAGAALLFDSATLSSHMSGAHTARSA